MQSGRLQPGLCAVHPRSPPPPAKSPAPAPAVRPLTVHPRERQGTRAGGEVGREGRLPRLSRSFPLSQWGSEQRKTGRGQGRAVGLRPEAVGTGQVNLRAAGDGILVQAVFSWGLQSCFLFRYPRVFLQRDAGTDTSASRFYGVAIWLYFQGNSGWAVADAPGSWVPGHYTGKLGLHLGAPSSSLPTVLVGNLIHSRLGRLA